MKTRFIGVAELVARLDAALRDAGLDPVTYPFRGGTRRLYVDIDDRLMELVVDRIEHTAREIGCCLDREAL